jgi:hypothetical protein
MTAKIYLKKRTTHYVEHLCSTILLNLISLFYSLGKKQFFLTAEIKIEQCNIRFAFSIRNFKNINKSFNFMGQLGKCNLCIFLNKVNKQLYSEQNSK